MDTKAPSVIGGVDDWAPTWLGLGGGTRLISYYLAGKKKVSNKNFDDQTEPFKKPLYYIFYKPHNKDRGDHRLIKSEYIEIYHGLLLPRRDDDDEEGRRPDGRHGRVHHRIRRRQGREQRQGRGRRRTGDVRPEEEGKGRQGRDVRRQRELLCECCCCCCASFFARGERDIGVSRTGRHLLSRVPP